MDSKELIELLTTFLKPTVWKDGFEIRNLETGKVITMDEIFDKVYGDLDVLEVLKKKKVAIDWNSNDVFTFDEYLTKEEENKIREWMKNGN